jgi:TonB family protein
LFSCTAWGQKSKDTTDFICGVPIYDMPHFPGGDEKLKKFIADNIKWPSTDWCGTGQVYIKFKVDSIGQISNATIYKGIDELADKEAIRVVSIMPKWIPAKRDGKGVDTWFILPISFKLK